MFFNGSISSLISVTAKSSLNLGKPVLSDNLLILTRISGLKKILVFVTQF